MSKPNKFKKINIVYFLLLCLLVSSVYSINITSGNISYISSVPKCSGTFDIVMSSPQKIERDELYIKDCYKLENNRWECDCNNAGFDINLFVKNQTKKSYDMVINYFLGHTETINITNVSKTSKEFVDLERNRRTKRINNINSIPTEIPKSRFKFEIKKINIIIVSVLIILTIFLLLLFKIIKKYKGSGNFRNNDIMNYNMKDDKFN